MNKTVTNALYQARNFMVPFKVAASQIPEGTSDFEIAKAPGQTASPWVTHREWKRVTGAMEQVDAALKILQEPNPFIAQALGLMQDRKRDFPNEWRVNDETVLVFLTKALGNEPTG